MKSKLVTRVAMVLYQERKFLEQQQENTDAAMRRLADQHRTAVAKLEHESLQLKHQLLRGLSAVLSAGYCFFVSVFLHTSASYWLWSCNALSFIS